MRQKAERETIDDIPLQHSLTVTRPALLDETGDRRFRCMVHDLLALSSQLESVRAGYGKVLGLTGIEYTILVATAHLRETNLVYVNRLADHLHLSGAFITLQTNKLAKKGYLTKTKDPDDGRRVQLNVTDQGRERLEELAQVQQQVNDVFYADLSADEFQLLSDMLNRMMRNGERAVSLVNYLSGLQTPGK